MRRAANLFERIPSRTICAWPSTRPPAAGEGRPLCGSSRHGLERRIAAMSDAIREGTIPVGRFQQFVIRDPKERVITAPCFDERVLHHAIMNVCEPVMDRWLIDDTFACRTGKGREAAIQRAQQFTRNSVWFLKLDVRKYFVMIASRTKTSESFIIWSPRPCAR